MTVMKIINNTRRNPMKKILTVLALVAGIAAIGAPALGTDDGGGGGAEMVTICHSEEGGVGETITLSATAAAVHLDTHPDDYLGECDVPDTVPGDTVPEEEEHVAPDPAVVIGAWIDGEWECDDTTVVQTRTVVTTPFIRETGQGKPRWVPDTANATMVTETQTRDLTDDEFEACPTTTTTVTPTTATPTTATPTTATPTIDAPATVAVATPPAPPAPAAVTPPAPQSLPSTGTETTIIAVIATLMTALGGAAIYAARRKPALGS